MIRQIKASAARAGETILGDTIGGCALVVMLIAALYLPGVFLTGSCFCLLYRPLGSGNSRAVRVLTWSRVPRQGLPISS